MIKFLKSQNQTSGMSLLSVLIALAISLILIMGLIGVFKNSFQAAKHVSQLNSESSLTMLVQTILGNEASCLTSFSKGFRPDIPKPQNISLYNSAKVPIVSASNKSKFKFDGLRVTSVTATPHKTDDQEYQVTLEIKTARIGDGTLSPVNSKSSDVFLVNLATDDKGRVVSCGTGDDPYKIVNVSSGIIDPPGTTNSYSMYNYVLNPPYPNGNTWESKMDHRACVNEFTGKKIRDCTAKIFPKTIDFKAKGNMLDLNFSALLSATGPGQTAQLDAYLLKGSKCIQKVSVHSVQTGGGLRDQATSNGSGRMIVNGITKGDAYRIRFLFSAPRYRDLAIMVNQMAPRLYDNTCGGNPVGGSFYCPIWATFWGGKYSMVEYQTSKASTNKTPACTFP